MKLAEVTTSSSRMGRPVRATSPTTPLPSSREYPTWMSLGMSVLSASQTKRCRSQSTDAQATYSQPNLRRRASATRWNMGRSSRSRVAMRATSFRTSSRRASVCMATFTSLRRPPRRWPVP